VGRRGVENLVVQVLKPRIEDARGWDGVLNLKVGFESGLKIYPQKVHFKGKFFPYSTPEYSGMERK